MSSIAIMDGWTAGPAQTKTYGERGRTTVQVKIPRGKGKNPIWITVVGWGLVSERMADIAEDEHIIVYGYLEQYESTAGDKKIRNTYVEADRIIRCFEEKKAGKEVDGFIVP